MGYWGWRPLMCALFISVWVAGCSAAPESAPTAPPTLTPQITLIVRSREPTRSPVPPTISVTPTHETADARVDTYYTVRPGDTLLGIAIDFGMPAALLQSVNPDVDPRALQVGQQLAIPALPDVQASPAASTPIPLELVQPACHEAPTDSIVCLGRIVNNLDFPVTQVQVSVQLLSAGGAVIAEYTSRIEQEIILPGVGAPYRALFKSHAYDSVTAALAGARAVSSSMAGLVDLVVEQEDAGVADGRYIVKATLYNPTSYSTGPVRLFLTVVDEMGQVTGYRIVATSSGLEPESRQNIRIEAIPQPGSTALTLSHRLYVEARRR